MAIKFHNPKSVVACRQLQPRRRGARTARACSMSRARSASIPRASCRPASTSRSRQVWKNIIQVLKSAGMGLRDIVKVNVFLTDSRFIAPYRTIRDRYFPERRFPPRPC